MPSWPSADTPASRFDALIRDIAREADARAHREQGRAERVAGYALALGVALQLPDADLVTLHRGALLHDIGNIAVPVELFTNAARLTPDEYELVKHHTTVGDELLAGLEHLRDLRPIVRSHHERADGSGYPDGLVESTTSLLARIVGVVDAFDALTSARPYRAPLAVEAACVTLLEEAERGWRSRPLTEELVALARSRRLLRLRHDVALS
jgi:putative two-component system response regulator